MAKATKRKASHKASSSEVTKRKATKKAAAKKTAPKKTAPKVAKKVTAKKPAAAKKVIRTKAAAPAGRATKVAAAEPTVKKVAKKARPVRAARTAGPKAPNAQVANPPLHPKPAVAARSVLLAAPAEFHSPATTVAKIRATAAAKMSGVKAPPGQTPTVGAQRAAAPKAPSTKSAKAGRNVARRATKPTTLVVSRTAIDTSLAAEIAANMVLNHMVSGPAAGHLERAVTDVFSGARAATPASAPKRETSTFKHLKETVANPTSHHLDGLFGVLAPQKRPKLPFNRLPAGTAQHIDKTFGLDVKRMNGLRRKAG